MRLHGRWAPLALTLVSLGVAGCGGSAPTPKPTVNVSITAPTSGAVVGVHRVVVAGTVIPATAQVLVAGQPAQVSGGRFTRSLFIATPRQVIMVTAQAQGYVAAQAATTVNYSPNLAAQLVASSSAWATPAAGASGSNSAPASNNALSTALALPKSATSSSRATGSAPVHTAPTHTTPSHTTPTHTTPTPTPTTPTHTTPTHTTPPPTPSPPAPSPTPPSSGGSSPPASSTPVLTVARIKQLWDTGCLKHAKGQKGVPYCTCIYNHLSAKGVFKTRATVDAFLKKLHAYGKRGDLSALSPAIQLALTVCSARLPPLTPVGGQPTLSRLPGLSHKRVPFPGIAGLGPKSP